MNETIDIDNFSKYTYAKRSHWELLKGHDLDLYKSTLNMDKVDLKKYQDLFTLKFIRDHIKKGARILDVGGGLSRILNHLNDEYECWNIDKFEGIGNGPLAPKNIKYKLIDDYMGNFSPELPDNYFDLVFSISTLEHVAQDDCRLFTNIIDDINRVMNNSGLSLHLFDIVYTEGKIRIFNKFIYHIFSTVNTCNELVHPDKVYGDSDQFFLSHEAYDAIWKRITKVSYEKFGQPTSLNLLWKKSDQYS